MPLRNRELAMGGKPITGVSDASNDDEAVNLGQMNAAISAWLPSGCIVMWSGTIATIPSGWYLCDGNNGTPNLTNKFLIAADADDAGAAKTTVTGSATQSGGSKDAINVSHTHTASVTDTGHSHTTDLFYTDKGGAASSRQWYGREGTLDVTTSFDSLASSTDTTGITVSNSTEGSSGTNANLPPYYAIAYIMKA